MKKETKNTSLNDPQEIKKIMFRLGHFDPSHKDTYGNQVLDYLVLDSLSTYGSAFRVTANDVRKTIKKTYLLDFEEVEINTAAKRLRDKKMLNLFTGDRIEKPQFQILVETEERINNNITKTRTLEDAVIQIWKEELLEKYKAYPVIKENIEIIVDLLHLFASRMFVRHGVECVALLYPDNEKTKIWLSEVGGSILKDMPKHDPFTDAIFRIEIPAFFRSIDPNRMSYITNLFNTSFFWHLIQVDEKCSRLLSEVTKGQTLFLDNNILYSLVGFDGANIMQSVHNLLKMSKALNYKLAITTKTIDEFYGSLDWHMKEHKKRPPVPAELARIALDSLGTNSFLTSYWEYFVKHKLSIEEFVTEKSHIDSLLDKLEIEKVSRYRNEIEKSKELVEEESILRSSCGNQFNDNIITHDAFHRILIQKVRKDPKYRFSDAVAWFLTSDTKLPNYDRFARKGSRSLPFCILTDEWIQINRPLLVRTSNQREYEESFHLLVTQPFLRTTMSTMSQEKTYNQVLGRLAHYKNMSPQLALNIVTDKIFLVTMSAEENETKIEEKIENKFVDLAAELESRKKELEKDVNTEKRTVEDLQARILQVERILEESRSRQKLESENLSKELEKEKSDRAIIKKELEVSINNSKTYEDSFIKVSKEFGQYKTTFKNWLLTFFVLAIASTALWLNKYWLNWHWFDVHRNKFLIELCFQILLIFAFLNIPLRKHWITWIEIIVAIFITIITLSS
jgi:hypothetical protein